MNTSDKQSLHKQCERKMQESKTRKTGKIRKHTHTHRNDIDHNIKCEHKN